MGKIIVDKFLKLSKIGFPVNNIFDFLEFFSTIVKAFILVGKWELLF